MLEAVGHEVTREYYFNDFNAQVRNLGLSVLARREGRDAPRGRLPRRLRHRARGRGARRGLAAAAAAGGRRRARCWAAGPRSASAPAIEASLAALGVRFDVWTVEGSIARRGLGRARARRSCAQGGHIYEQDGATWFRSTAFGDDKDRVVIRSNGQPTYFASDIGYLAEKFSRGFDELIYLWGEDHHGTVARNRMRPPGARLRCASACSDLLMAWVRFVRDGQEIGMSKRAGEFITLDELLREIGPDAARWFFGSRATSTGIDFDIDLAKRQSAENPVYYVQYAHARCVVDPAQRAGRVRGAR